MQNDMQMDIAAVHAIEDARCELISSNDIDGFGRLLGDDYAHVHITGRIDDKAGALVSFMNAPRQCWRGELSIRVYGDVAIASGPQINRMPREDGSSEDRTLIATTVLNRRNGEWKIVHFHACSTSQ